MSSIPLTRSLVRLLGRFAVRPFPRHVVGGGSMGGL